MTDMYGCSDHNCIYGHAGGMGTNGGCRCEKELHRIGPEGKKAARQIRLLRAENERLRPDAERYLLHRTGNHSDVLMEVPPGSDNWEPLVGDHLDKATDAAMEVEE